ncbi:MAG: hypothetical protein GX682_05955 [Clostridiaceae bacterium]|nr:hypothetical protein [Clostridiaceae bacterium]
MAEENKRQEAVSFVGKKGPVYASDSATENEKDYFEGTLYKNGQVDLSLLSYYSSPLQPF